MGTPKHLEQYNIRIKRTAIYDIPLASDPGNPMKVKNIAVQLVSRHPDAVNIYTESVDIEVLEVK